MRQANLILLILLSVGKTNLELRSNQLIEPSIWSDFTIGILTRHFGSIRKMAVIFSKKFAEVSKIIQGVNVPVTLNAEEIRLQGLDTREPPEVVLSVEQPLNVSKLLSQNIWTSDTRFILLVDSSNDTEEILLKTFRIFWKANVVNVFAFVKNVAGVLIYSYAPFVSKNCEALEIVAIDEDSDEFTAFNKLNNLKGCQVNVTVVDLPPMAIFSNNKSRNGTFELEGTEAGIVYEISKKLNFKPRFAVARDGEAWGWIHPVPHGTVGEVYQKYSHFGFGLLATTLERYECLDMTVPVSPLRECITWAVPVGAAESQETWLQIYINEFPLLVWGCIGIVFCLGTFFFWLITKAFFTSSFIRVFIFMFSSFISVPVKSPTQASLRSLFLAWIWYSFIILISYQSLMGSKLTVPYRPRDIETIQDLLDSKLRFTGFYNTFRLVTSSNDGDLKKVASRLEATNYGIKEAIHYIIYDRNIAYMRETTSFKYFTMINPIAKGNVHFMEECVYQYYPIMVLQRRSPLTRKTNEIIAILFESGILDKWRSRYIYDIILPPPLVIQLSLKQMRAPFIALSIGIAISFVTFVIEQLYFYFSNKNLLKIKSCEIKVETSNGTPSNIHEVQE